MIGKWLVKIWEFKDFTGLKHSNNLIEVKIYNERNGFFSLYVRKETNSTEAGGDAITISAITFDRLPS